MAEHAVAAQSRTRQPVDMIVAGIVVLINIVNSVDTVQASYLSNIKLTKHNTIQASYLSNIKRFKHNTLQSWII